MIPAALAIAEQTGATGRRFLSAVVAGYEVACRLAMALDARRHSDRGFHPTATVGPFAASAAAAAVLGLSSAQVANAFGIALSQAAGTLQFFANGAWTKRLHAGLAGYNGLLAVELARRGFVGAAEPFEGDRGLLRAYTSQPHPELVTAGLGERFALLEVEPKPYPAGRYAHAPLDAVLKLVRQHDLMPEEIESVWVGVSEIGANNMGLPLERKRDVRNVVDAQLSIPFLVAAAIVRRRLDGQSTTSLVTGRSIS